MCCVFVGLDNELYKMHGTYIKISDQVSRGTRSFFLQSFDTSPIQQQKHRVMNNPHIYELRVLYCLIVKLCVLQIITN
jgi:hypothetical protein